jgi:hypothetical protein
MSHDRIRQILTRMRSEYTRAHPSLPDKEALLKDADELRAAIAAMPDRATGPSTAGASAPSR